MDDTNQQTIEKDFDLIGRDCDGNGSFKDSSECAQESENYRKNNNGVEILDNESVVQSINVSSNGVDNCIITVDESLTSHDSNVNDKLLASNLELPQSNISQINSECEAWCENTNNQTKSDRFCDNDGDKVKPEAEDSLVSNEEISKDIKESVGDSAYFNFSDDRNEINNSIVIENKSLTNKNLSILNEDILITENTINESDQVKQSFNEIICKVDNTFERDVDNENLKIMSYEKKVENLNDAELRDSDNSENKTSVTELEESEDNEKSFPSFTENSPLRMNETLKDEASQEYEEQNNFDELKIMAKDENDLQESESLMELSNGEAAIDKNSVMKQVSHEDEEDILDKYDKSFHKKEVDDFSKVDSVSDVMESQEKNDSISKEMQCVEEGSLPFSPNNLFDNQVDELVQSKNDLLDIQTERNELLSTEIINCNDESQMDINENDKDVEVNNIDVEQNEEIDKKHQEMEIEEIDVNKNMEYENLDKDFDKKDKHFEIKDQYMAEETETDKQIVSVEENEGMIQPGGSEEETITGDTSNEGPLNNTRGKDAEICIIPDDVTPRLSIPSQEKLEQKGTGENPGDNLKEDVKILKVTSLEQVKCKERDEGKIENESATKARPIRVAAKLAGNKIKSLVQNDFSLEKVSPKTDTEAEDSKPDETACAQCSRVKSCKFQVIQGGRTQLLCSDQCYNTFLKSVQQEVDEVEQGELVRKCAQCQLKIVGDENTLSWETMDFCNEECLGKCQTELGSNCANCKGSVASVSLGKYCVRFGYDVKQFCTSSCLEEYKKGLKVCSYCQKDISMGAEGFLAPVGDKGQFKDFCTQSCMEKYEQMSNNTPPPIVIAECAVCSNSKPVKVEVELDNKTQKLCSEPCFAAFKFVNNITEGQCDMCKKYFDRVKIGNFSIYYEDSPHTFCCKTCMNVYILANRKIVPCNWCKVKKYNFDMIKKVSVTGQVLMMCSLNCLTLYQVSVNAVTSRRMMCDFCLSFAQAKYHLTMSDATVRNFCSYACVMSFQNQYPKQTLTLPATDRLASPIPTSGPKRILPKRSQVGTSTVPVISSVQSLASPNGPASGTRVTIPGTEVNLVSQVASISQPITIQSTVPAIPAPPPPQVYQHIITKPAPIKQQKNKSILCKPYSHTKGVSCRPHPCMKETQTDESLNRKCLIPVPVPIFVPAPMMMFSAPFPIAVPFPLPVPVPIFIPTTRNSAKGIFKEIKKIQEKIPTDPFEAELLMMAEMVAGDKKQDPTDSESDEGNDGDDGGDGTFSPENVDTSNTFGEDMLQIALKMATELEEPAVDMESVLTSNTITPTSQPTVDPNKGLYDDPEQVQVMPMNRGRKRSMRGTRNSSGGSQSKRGRRISGSNVDVPMLPPPEPVPPPRIEVEKPDANMCLKYTFGVNAWRHWVMQKNAELEKAAMTNRKIKLFKPELLQLTADELNFSLCLFVKEVRKPNGAEYAPDTIYYLCLGIQQYLFENGRIDNIFTDSYYEKFTDCLDEVAKKFAALYNDSQYIVTRVEEEHLWESKQLGAHSPHVLLSTLMFFNTKHFNLVTVEEHMQLSFSHIMKHWKRNPNSPGVAKVPGSRNVLLRFYPPQSALEANSRKKKVYEQQENEENPLRCPVKLYEFYLSKCPESVKTRNDVFYLLPERSCVPDSPVWYSTMALGKEPLTKMLHRVKMVKEINIALLTC